MRVLIVEDNPDHRYILRKKLQLSYSDATVDTCATVSTAVKRLLEKSYRIVLLDYRLRGSCGVDLVKWMGERGIDTPVIMITGVEDIEIAVQAIKLGVYDYLTKSAESFERLPFILRKADEEYDLRRKLRVAEQNYQALVNGIGEAVFRMMEDGSIVYISPSIRNLLGYDERKFIVSFMDLFPAESWEGLIRKLGEVVRGNTVDPWIEHFNRPDGTRVFIEINCSSLVEEDGRKSVIGTMQDVTKRVMLEREIQSERAKLMDVFNAMADPIYIVDEEYNITFINRSLRRQIGRPVQGRCYDYLYSYTSPCSFCKWDAVRKEDTVRWELKRKDGRIFDIISSPLHDPNGAIRKMEMMRDITMRKEAEENARLRKDETERVNRELLSTIERLKAAENQLIQSAKLAAIGQLVAGVAHELNNPLFSAMGNAELLLMEPGIEEDRETKLKSIIESVERAKRIVNDLVQFSRKETLSREVLSINGVIRKTAALREYELKVNDIELECSLTEDLPRVEGNPIRLQQVFLNIIVNAEQAIVSSKKTGGKIRILTRPDPVQPSVIIEIANNGPHIPADIIARIFEPFFTTKEVGEGTGLGLSTSYGIVQEHGGTMTVKSTKQWTVFTVVLPVSKAADAGDTAGGGEKSGNADEGLMLTPKDETILVLDDEPVILRVLEGFLSRQGFSVFTASTGEEALSKLEIGKVDFIVSDIKMPGMSGREFYKQVSRRKPELANRLLFVTGDTLSEGTREFLKSTGINHLQKPFTFIEIMEALSSLGACTGGRVEH